MSRFAQTARTALPHGPTRTISDVRIPTYNGGAGFAKDARTELFSLAVTNFVGQDTFYEDATARDARFVGLVREVAALDPEWIKAFLPWLRTEANMRTASVIAAVEAAAVLARTGVGGGRQLIASTLARPDEPAEALAYWMQEHGRAVPKPIKRGIADATVKLYNENAALKYDSREHRMRMFDVIDLCHPKAKAMWQHMLFTYLGDKRHNRDNPRFRDELSKIAANRAMHVAANAGEEITELVDGGTWEALSAHGPMDAAKWEIAIPQMKYMATLRNLRNFEQANISVEAMNRVEAKLIDPAEVAASRQFPFRFWSAWKNSGTMRFGRALETALDLSLRNVPEFRGKTLIMIDVSGSMKNALAQRPPKSRRPGVQVDTMPITRREAGTLFGSAVMKRSAPGSMIGVYATGVMAVDKVPTSTLRLIEDLNRLDGINGQGTNTWPSTKAMWDSYGPFDRILIFTDEQHNPSHLSADVFPKHVPIYVWNLAGYTSASMDVGSGRYLLGGLTDQAFKTIRMLENAQTGRWPWEV